jgi:FAD/FMN-containing dehydrogenase
LFKKLKGGQKMAEKELVKIVGSKNVLGGMKSLEEYSKDLSFVPRVRPRCVVKPESTDEVQAIVKWANETLTPLVPVSSGAPHFRGDTVPSVGEAVIVDLSRMNRIIRVDNLNNVALVEPGVTFGELQSELNKSGLYAYMPLAPRSSKSVIGSVLEREPITMPAQHWDSVDPLLCAEIVFGTGDKIRSGEAAGPDTIEEQWEVDKVQLSPYGPSHMDIARLVSGAQGTIGIVTWASLKCHSMSKSKRSFLVPSDNVQPLIDLSYQLVRFRLGSNLFLLNGLNLACLLGHTSRDIQGLRNILPPWVLFISFEDHGPLPEEKVKYQEADFKDMAHLCHLKPLTILPGANAEEVSQLLTQPSSEPYWKLRFQGGCHDIFFLTTLDKTPGFVAAMTDLVLRHRHPVEDMGVYIQAIVQGTSCHCEFSLYYDPKNPAELDRTKQLVSEGAEELAGMGGFFSRPYGAWKDLVYRRAAGTLTMQRKVKEIFDPNKILNPGKLCF